MTSLPVFHNAHHTDKGLVLDCRVCGSEVRADSRVKHAKKHEAEGRVERSGINLQTRAPRFVVVS